MTDPRIEIAARALRQIEHMLGVALSDAEHGSGPDHDPGQIMCDAMGDARELAFEAYRAMLDAARPEIDGDAVVEAAMDPEADAVWRMIYDACTGGNGATGFRIFQRALTAARAPAAPDENVRQAVIDAAKALKALENNPVPYSDYGAWRMWCIEKGDAKITLHATLDALAAIEAAKDAKP